MHTEPRSSKVPPRTLRTKDAAAYLSISVGTLRKLVREAKIRVIFGTGLRSPWRFDIRELDKHIEDIQFPSIAGKDPIFHDSNKRA